MNRVTHATKCAAIAAGVLGLGGCAVHPPTIAHVHIGHALTGVHVTPDRKGYLLVAERRADEALQAARNAVAAPNVAQQKAAVAQVMAVTDSPENFGVRQSLVMAANHISFAATSPDASANVQQAASVFSASIAPVIARCDYMKLLASDFQNARTPAEASVVVAEIEKLALANVEGDDSNGDGVRGSVASEYGMAQLRAQLQGMIARESPPYRTVDEWYLFNLVRLPNGRWVFDRLSRGGNIEGYK